MSTITMTAELVRSLELDAYAVWERETAKVEKAMRCGIISEAEGTRKLIALDARLDAALGLDR